MNFKEITGIIKKTLDSSRIPAMNVPPLLLTMGGQFRPGISATLIASRIISRQTEAGAPYGPSADGNANISEAMERIRIEEIVDALKNESKVQVTIPKGAIQIIAQGASAAGPVTVEGSNPKVINAYGIIQ